MNAVVTQNICAEGVALRWDRGAINALQKDILLLFVARSVTLNSERHKAYEVEREGTKPYCDKAESDGRGPFVGDIESDQTNPQVETGQSTAFLNVVNCTEKKDAWFVTLKVKRMRLRFKIVTGADVTIITKKTWLAMKDKPRLEPTAVRLNSVGGQLKAFGQFMVVTKHRNTVYRFNVIVIEGEKMINLHETSLQTWVSYVVWSKLTHRVMMMVELAS